MTLPASTFTDPGQWNQSADPLQPQPLGGGGAGYTPMPAQTGKNGNPFTDVLDHVSAFNDAMNPQSAPTPSGIGPGGPMPVRAFSATNPNTGTGSDALVPGATPTPPAAPSTGLRGPLTPSTPQGETPTQKSETPQATLTKTVTVPGAAAFTDQQLADHYKTGQPFTPEMQAILDQRNPKPPGTEDPAVAATWYRGFAFLDPSFGSITEADVTNQRMLATSGKFADMGHPEWNDIGKWVLAEKPGGQYGVDPNGGYVAPRGQNNGPSNYDIIEAQNAAAYAAAQPPATTPTPPGTTPPAGGTTPPAGTTPPGGATPPPGTTPPAGTPPPPTTPPPDIQSLIDMFHKEAGTGNGPDVEKLLSPMFQRQQQILSDKLRAEAALTPGRLESGGFGENEADALATLSGQQSATLADSLQQQHLAQMQQNTQLIQLGTQAGMQKYVADLNADMTKFQVNTNADLQKWLDNSDNTLKKYGIDTGDVLARYQSELQLKGQMYSADKGVDAAALQAAAAHAAAAASAQASQANAQLQYNLGMQGLSVDREKNIGAFILGLLGIGNMDLNSLTGILNGILPGTVAVKP